MKNSENTDSEAVNVERRVMQKYINQLNEADILSVLPDVVFRENTYIIRNRLAMTGKFKGLKTSSVLYRLRKMEEQGLVVCLGKDGLGYLWEKA